MSGTAFGVAENVERARAPASHRLPSGHLAGLLELAIDKLIRELEKQCFAIGRTPRVLRAQTEGDLEASIGPSPGDSSAESRAAKTSLDYRQAWNMPNWLGRRTQNGTRVGVRRGVRAVGWGVAVLCALCVAAGIAEAQVFQTDDALTPLPQPVGAAELELGTSYGYSFGSTSYKDPSGALPTTPILYGRYYAPPAFPQFVTGDELTLAGLFKWRKEQINPITDAKTAPGHFFPGCGFSAELVLHGATCSSALGWYNVTPSRATPPAASEIFRLIPGDTSYLAGIRTEFVPLGWDNRDPRDLSTLDWTPKSFSSGAIQSDPRYKGGDVAFALVADPLTRCSQNKFSVYEHNVKNSSGVPWVTALIYKSTVDPSGIYLAFEDLPMPTADWLQTGNDGDFNDFVFFISGLGATAACPDPACKTVTCDASTTCSGGVCVPSGSGGAGAGGSANGGGGGGGGGTSVAGASAAGGPSASGGEAGSPMSASGGFAGDASVGDASAGDATTVAGSAGTGPSGDTANGGRSGTTATGGSGTTTKLTNGGCSCRMGLKGAARYHLIWLALSAAFIARRQRFQRG